MAQQLHRVLIALAISTCVVVLLGHGRPPAVCFAVAVDEQVVVHPIDGVEARRSTAHVFEEVLVAEPALTYGDPAPAIVVPEIMIWVDAPRQHVRPSSVFGCLLPVARLSMLPTRSASFHALLYAQTSTRRRHAVAKHRAGHNLFDAALATAHPPEFLPHVLSLAQHNPSSVGSSRQIVFDRHRGMTLG